MVAPTLMAVEMHAGALIELVNPSFPDAITVATPTERRLSMDALSGSASQLVVLALPPKLMFTDAMVVPA